MPVGPGRARVVAVVTRAYAALALLGLFALGGWYLHHVGYASGALDNKVRAAELAQHVAELATEASEAARKAERAQAAAFAALARDYEQDKINAQANADRVIADLRAGHLRLRKQWTCPAADRVPRSPTGAGISDAGAELRAAGAADLVRVGDECDAQVLRLQQAVRAMQ